MSPHDASKGALRVVSPRRMRVASSFLVDDGAVPVTVVTLGVNEAIVWVRRDVGGLCVGGSGVLVVPSSTSTPLRLPAHVVAFHPEAGIDARGQVVGRAELRFGALAPADRVALEELLVRCKPAAIAVGLGSEAALRVQLTRDPSFELIELDTAVEVESAVEAREISAIVLGPGLTPAGSAQLLTELAQTFPGVDTANIVLAYGRDKALFQHLVAIDRVFYLSESPGRSTDVAQVVASAVRDRSREEAPRAKNHLPAARRLGMFDLARRVSAARSVDAAVAQLVRWTVATLSSARAHVLLYDGDAQTLSAPAQDGGPARCESAASGLAAFAARTATSICVPRAQGDPRYDREADDPSGTGEERLAVVPIGATGSRPTAVLVAVRAAAEPPFSGEDMELLAAVADETASALDRVVAEARILAQQADQPFRVEALAQRFGADERPGDVLRLSPAWTGATYAVLLAAFALALIGSLVFHVREYATGQAVIRFEDKSDLTTAREGVVAALSTRPGDVVVKGQSLVQLTFAAESAEVERLGREFDLQLAALLREPVNQSARAQLATIRAQREAAEARLSERTLHAPRDGIVSGVRVRVGQKINAGDVVLSLVGDKDIHVIALLPGRYRAELKPGTTLRFQLSGYEHVYQTNAVDAVGEVVSAQEALRFVGLEPTPPPDSGPVVLVRSRLQRATYEAGDRTYRYHDGMPGTAEVAVRSEPVLVTLVPWLRHVLAPSD
jgi:GAF domain-containing protein